jgi:hypothetical protein
MTTFTYRGFRVTISKLAEGYGFVANNGKHTMAQPNPGYSDETFSTRTEAEEGAKQSIFIYEVTAMFTYLSAVEQAFIAYIIKQVYKKKWIVDSRTDIVQQVLKAGGIKYE